MEFQHKIVSYQMELTPLFNQQGDIVLLYLKDNIDDILRYKNGNFFQAFPKISIESYKFLKENQLVSHIRDVYQMMIENNNRIISTKSESMEKYVDAFMEMEYITEDITNEGILSINRNESSFLWLINQPEWIVPLANHQYKIMVNLIFKEEKS